MNDLMHYHLAMAKVLDTAALKARTLVQAQKLYKLSKHQSKFYNMSVLAMQALEVCLCESKSNSVNSDVSREYHNGSQSSDSLLPKLKMKLVSINNGRDEFSEESLYGLIEDGRSGCVATCHICINGTKDEKIQNIFDELIVSYDRYWQ